MCVIACLDGQFAARADPIKKSTQTFLERSLWTPVKLSLCRLDVAPRRANITVAEFRHDGRFWGIADGSDLLSQLMDGGWDT